MPSTTPYVNYEDVITYQFLKLRARKLSKFTKFSRLQWRENMLHDCETWKKKTLRQFSIMVLNKLSGRGGRRHRSGIFFQLCTQVTSKQRIFTDTNYLFCERSGALCVGYGPWLNGYEVKHEVHAGVAVGVAHTSIELNALLGQSLHIAFNHRYEP